jgi:putative spermidine/putrescine transport system ATP-binding protein
VSVRADRMSLSSDVAGGLTASVRDVEYQGTVVYVSLATEAGLELMAIVPERAFYQRPYSPGETVAVHWDPTDVHEFAAVN